ncbi:hypothetical protein [Rathayibacter tanaceti]|uniref:hypothetical protein n=1 Tax=Rathayibacter tanaceti TaxID=1671680 RepID=UPI001F546AD9|nr:hypothetical protein [Rathayibacter tanaceti]
MFGSPTPRALQPATPTARVFTALIRSSDFDLGAGMAAMLEQLDGCFASEEQRQVLSAMPVLSWAAAAFAMPTDRLRVIFRDHLVENSLGFISALLGAGVPAADIVVLDKGDATLNRERVAMTLQSLGVEVRRLDNAAVNHTTSAAEAARAEETARFVDRFTREGHDRRQKVIIIDDGGLLALTDAAGDPVLRERPDAAIELTVSGLKRLASSRLSDGLPVANMARSDVKQRIGYNEIADSCMRRLREALRGEKLIGMRVVSVGYGTLGARLASSLRSLGCRVVVVDTDHLQLISAAENGFETTPDLDEAIRTRPKLLVSSTGERIAERSTLEQLPADCYLTAFATADLSAVTGVEGFGPATVLGDGRSFNLYQFEGIPNGGYDLYRAATFIVLSRLAALVDGAEAGAAPSLALQTVNDWIRDSGVYTRYYDLYFSSAR